MGNANAPAAELVFAIQQGSNQLGTQTVSIPAGMVPGWSDVAYWTVGPFGTGYHLFEVALVVNNQIVDHTSNNLDLQ
ncbi:hypothetical protein [Litoreibacter janthinus]|uniref:hypothetical protein n=1 Tax=Litoreibacter janthinus TaxID=670154 RepID=UPI000B7E8319|nr:hypothetical protein [Litoreibacter janthinus]